MPPTAAQRQQEFDELYSRFHREVWAVAYSRWSDSDLALDIVQEAYMRLWKQWEAGEEIQNARAWLVRVARNLAEDYAKSAFRRNGTSAPQTMTGIRSGEMQPPDVLEKNEALAQVRCLLGQLTPTDRDILTLRYSLDYDAAQIAEVLGIQASAVHMRLSRARARLAEILEEGGMTSID